MNGRGNDQIILEASVWNGAFIYVCVWKIVGKCQMNIWTETGRYMYGMVYKEIYNLKFKFIKASLRKRLEESLI